MQEPQSPLPEAGSLQTQIVAQHVQERCIVMIHSDFMRIAVDQQMVRGAHCALLSTQSISSQGANRHRFARIFQPTLFRRAENCLDRGRRGQPKAVHSLENRELELRVQPRPSRLRPARGTVIAEQDPDDPPGLHRGTRR